MVRVSSSIYLCLCLLMFYSFIIYANIGVYIHIYVYTYMLRPPKTYLFNDFTRKRCSPRTRMLTRIITNP